jgi:prepilin-type N-terminal cleavage/methylation domain-containing protein
MRSERGFTLLETLLALAIGGLVLGAAYTAVVRAAAARDGAVARTAGVASGRRVLLEMARTIESAAPSPFMASERQLQIAAGDPEPRLVAYGLEGTRLLERRTSPFAASSAEAAPPRVLLDDVRDFTVRCFDGGAWTSGWNSESAPRAVELTLQAGDGEALRTRVVLRLEGG